MLTNVISGSVAVLGDFVSADAILPARFSFVSRDEMAKYVLTDISEDTNKRIREHDIIIAGEAFGYGTGRESPARALNAAGVKAIIGGPFGRPFFRNAINNGVLIIDCAEIAKSGIADGDRITIDTGKCKATWGDKVFTIPRVPDVIKKIIAAGSLIEYGKTLVANAPARGAA